MPIRYTIFFSFLCGMFLISLDAFSQDTISLRVLTYNIHHGEGNDGVLDLDRIAGVISSVTPDIVALQEVDVKTERTNQIDQAQVLAEKTGLHVHFGRAIHYSGGEYGNAILSRYPISNVVIHRLPEPEGREKRILLQADIPVPMDGGTKTISFIATHLDNVSEEYRMTAIPALQKITQDRLCFPTLFAGDLNAVPESELLLAIGELFTSAILKNPLLTSPASNPQRQIDYIMMYPKNRWNIKHVEVLDEVVASDHRPLFSILELID